MNLTSKHTDFSTFYRSEHRYAFNGMESDSEVKGQGNSYTTFYRMLDPRIGRWFSTDPVTHAGQSPYVSMDNNPIWYNDILGNDVINGDREDADRKKGKMEAINEGLTKFKDKHNINDETNRRKFLKGGGEKKDWKRYKEIKGMSQTAARDYKYAEEQAGITQGVIDRWKEASPNLFDEVDKQVTDFVLTTGTAARMGSMFGGVTPDFSGSKENPTTPKRLKVIIAKEVNLTSVDEETGQFSLNHEAGHFLYIVKYTSTYIKYLLKGKADGTYVVGGHGETDESGKVAHKLGQKKDIKKGGLNILEKGN